MITSVYSRLRFTAVSFEAQVIGGPGHWRPRSLKAQASRSHWRARSTIHCKQLTARAMTKALLRQCSRWPRTSAMISLLTGSLPVTSSTLLRGLIAGGGCRLARDAAPRLPGSAAWGGCCRPAPRSPWPELAIPDLTDRGS